MLPKEIPVHFTIRPKHLLLSPLVVFPAMGLFYLPWGGESAPAWVQAIGSIGAIWAGFGVLAKQNQAAEKREADARRTMRDKIVAILVHIDAVLDSDDPYNKSLYPYEFGLAERFSGAVENCDYLLKEIGFKDIYSHVVGIHWLELRRAISDLRRLLSAYEKVAPLEGDSREEAEKNFAIAGRSARRSVEMLLEEIRVNG